MLVPDPPLKILVGMEKTVPNDEEDIFRRFHESPWTNDAHPSDNHSPPQGWQSEDSRAVWK